MIMGSFIQNQILGMQWLKTLIGKMLSAAGLDIESRFGGSLHFFLYDVIKITILLFVLIFLISYTGTYALSIAIFESLLQALPWLKFRLPTAILLFSVHGLRV